MKNFRAEKIAEGVIRLTSGVYNVQFEATNPDAFDAAANVLLEMVAGFSKHDLMMATLRLNDMVAKSISVDG